MAAESNPVLEVPARPPDDHRGNGPPRTQPVFLLALLAGLALHVAGLALFHVDIKIAGPAKRPAAFINYPREDRAAVFHDEAMIKDPEPIFLLTEHNYASPEIVKEPYAGSLPALARPQAAFAAYPAEMNLVEPDFLPVTASATEPDRPADILGLGEQELFKAAGRAPLGGAALPPRDARLQVRTLGAGAGNNSDPAASVVWEETWPATTALEQAAQKTGNSRWAPVTFLLIFDQAGLTAQPLLLKNSYGNSSGNIEVDEYLRQHLDQEFRRHALPAGIYEALVGP